MSTLPDRMTITVGTDTALYVKQTDAPGPPNWTQTAMVHYSQSDSRWADFEYAPGFPMLEFGCLLTSIAMVGSLYYGEGITPLSVAQALSNRDAFDGGMLARPWLISEAWPRLVYSGRVDWDNVAADLGTLRYELDHYGATVIKVQWDASRTGQAPFKTHFVALTQIGLHGAQIVDSWDGKTKELLNTQYSAEGWLVSRAIYGVRRYRITSTLKGASDAKRD